MIGRAAATTFSVQIVRGGFLITETAPNATLPLPVFAGAYDLADHLARRIRELDDAAAAGRPDKPRG